jgi:uncharacterized phosphatase
MKTIYYVRHGESEGNAAGVLVGASMDSPLTKLGEQQAKQAALLLGDKNIELVVSSPLLRALRTAEIIAKEIGYSGQILTDPLLLERDFGEASGLPRKQAFELLDSPNAAKGVESVETFYDRMQQALDWLRALPAERIMVAGHAGAGKMLTAAVNGTPAADFLQYKSLDHAAIYEFTLE